MAHTKISLVRVALLALAAGTGVGYANASTGAANHIPDGHELRSSLLECAAGVDDPDASFVFADVATVTSTYGLDLPTVLPAGYVLHDEAMVEVDPWDSGWSVDFFFTDPSNAGEGMISLQSASYTYRSSPFASDTTHDPLDGLESSAIGWVLPTGDYRILSASDEGVTRSELQAMACSMSSYNGEGC